jgi:hypothetical protein
VTGFSTLLDVGTLRFPLMSPIDKIVSFVSVQVIDSGNHLG